MISILDNEILRGAGVGEAGGVRGAVSMLLEEPSGSGSGMALLLDLLLLGEAAAVNFRLEEAEERMRLSIFEIFILTVTSKGEMPRKEIEK